MKQKILSFLFLALMGGTATLRAFDFETDGFYFDITDQDARTVSVASGDNEYAGDLTVPKNVTHDGKRYTVTAVGDRAFQGNAGLTSVILPDGLEGIGAYAFASCLNLVSVTMPESLKSIGEFAFSLCTSLTTAAIPNGVTRLGDCAFLYCSGLSSVTIPASVTTFGREVFNRCTGLTSVTIAEGVTSISASAFFSCSSLASITIPASVTSIGDRAFTGCSGLTSVVVQEGNAKYDSRGGCNAIIETASNTLLVGCRNTVIPEDVVAIGKEAFYSCSELASVTIPAGLTSIGDLAFMGCGGLTEIKVQEGNSTYDSRGDCNAIVETASNTLIVGCQNSVIPESVTSIGSNAFYGCTGLASLTIPEGVKRIGDYAFLICSDLTTITFPSTLASIGSRAFCYCSSLKNVFSYAGNVPTTSADAFEYSNIEEASLFVPDYAYEVYSTTEPWSNFGNIVAEKEVKLCAKPTISFAGGKLAFKCETEGVTFNYDITDEDIKSGTGSEITLTATYHISVYASKEDHEDSETVTATLCWIAVEPQTEGLTDEDAVAEVKSLPVLIQTAGSTITVQGAADGTEVAVYGIGGKKQASVLSVAGCATLSTSLPSGTVAVVKIGETAVKVLMK